MQSISISYFLALFDEFKTVPQPKLKVYLDLAATRVSQQVWGETWQAGVSYLAAHMLVKGGGAAGTQTGSGGAMGGTLTDVTVGDLSKSFTPLSDSGTGDDTYKTTSYGIMFLELRRETVMGFGVTGNPLPPVGTVIC